jgi:hypothetical protein
MRVWFSNIGLSLALAGGGSASDGGPGSFATNQRIVYSDGLHNENTEMIRFHGRILLVFRGGEEGQIGSRGPRLVRCASRVTRCPRRSLPARCPEPARRSEALLGDGGEGAHGHALHFQREGNLLGE